MKNIKLELPDDFFREEIRCGYTVTSEMKKIWAVEFDLLNEFMRVCQKHHLKWWVDGGTMLGAIRHHGMIPWDDDIDVAMMSDDYEKLCSVAATEFHHPYFFQTEETDPGSLSGHAQLRNSLTTGILKSELDQKFPFNQGIFIDIFPLYSIPDDDEEFQKQIARVAKYRNKARTYYLVSRKGYHFEHRKNVPVVLLHCIEHLLATGFLRGHFDYQVPYREYINEVKKYDDIERKRVAKVIFGNGKPSRIWQRSWFDELEYVPFEMFTVPVPKDYEAFLDRFYGDWHSFVIGNDAHGGCFFDTDHPYTYYL